MFLFFGVLYLPGPQNDIKTQAYYTNIMGDDGGLYISNISHKRDNNVTDKYAVVFGSHITYTLQMDWATISPVTLKMPQYKKFMKSDFKVLSKKSFWGEFFVAAFTP